MRLEEWRDHSGQRLVVTQLAMSLLYVLIAGRWEIARLLQRVTKTDNIFQCHVDALAQMRAAGMCGIAKKDHSLETPPFHFHVLVGGEG